ncbi:MAG: YgjV family protein, partial [Clostridia bacterium]|nr:YgjV family protein [Clostridia bacterium]
MINFIAQAISIIGMALSIMSFQCKENKKFFITQALSGACFAVSFLLLGSTTAAFLNFINIFRGWVFGFAPKKYRGVLAISVAVLFILSTVFTYAGWLSLLVLVAQL